jgi:hypothetical protein
MQLSNNSDENLAQRYRNTTHLSGGRELPDTTASDESMQWLKAQTSLCNKNHKVCRDARLESTPKPRRLLRLDLKSSISVHLIESSNEHGNYACLSHCWGPRPLIRTLKSNVDQFKENIP